MKMERVNLFLDRTNLVIVFTVIIGFTAFSPLNADVPSPDMKTAIMTMIDYFNKSTSLADRIQVVEKYYESERDAGIFKPARLRQPPANMQNILDDLENINFELKDMDDALDPKVEEDLINKLKEIQKTLEFNFGPFVKNFRVQSNDPMAHNMKAVRTMKELWDKLMEEFTSYTETQYHAMKALKKIKELGIHFHPPDNQKFNLIVDEKRMKEMLKEQGKMEKDIPTIVLNYIFAIVPGYQPVPVETSEEIQALQDLLEGKEIDAETKQMLQNFIPQCNTKSAMILITMKELEKIVDKIDTESQAYAFYYVDKRDEIYQLLFDLKRRLGFAPDDWTTVDDFGTLKDEHVKHEL